MFAVLASTSHAHRPSSHYEDLSGSEDNASALSLGTLQPSAAHTRVTVSAGEGSAACGDGVRQTEEQCDDG